MITQFFRSMSLGRLFIRRAIQMNTCMLSSKVVLNSTKRKPLAIILKLQSTLLHIMKVRILEKYKATEKIKVKARGITLSRPHRNVIRI